MRHVGTTVWLTGLSGAGKTTISDSLSLLLQQGGYDVEVLDGEIVRRELSPDLGFSKADRDLHIRRVGFMASLLARHGIIVIVAAISPYRALREEMRRLLGSFIEVYVNAPICVCESRDPKGLYKMARAGKLIGFTGIDDPYEIPLSPDLECRTDEETVAESTEKILKVIARQLNEK